jgi:hypothetical protein
MLLWYLPVSAILDTDLGKHKTLMEDYIAFRQESYRPELDHW